MSTCVLLTVTALALLLYVLFSSREVTDTKEGFVEYVVFGPGPWWGVGPRRPWWRHRFYRPYRWPTRAYYFF